MFKQLSSAFMQQPDSQVVIFISINSLVFINLNIFFNSMCTSQCPLQMDNFLSDKQADKSFQDYRTESYLYTPYSSLHYIKYVRIFPLYKTIDQCHTKNSRPITKG